MFIQYQLVVYNTMEDQKKKYLLSRIKKEEQIIETQYRNFKHMYKGQKLPEERVSPYFDLITHLVELNNSFAAELFEYLEPQQVKSIFQRFNNVFEDLFQKHKKMNYALTFLEEENLKKQTKTLCQNCQQGLDSKRIESIKQNIDKEAESRENFIRKLIDESERQNAKPLFTPQEDVLFKIELQKALKQKEVFLSKKIKENSEFLEKVTSEMTAFMLEVRNDFGEKEIQPLEQCASWTGLMKNFVNKKLTNSFQDKIPDWIKKMHDLFIDSQPIKPKIYKCNKGIQTSQFVSTGEIKAKNETDELRRKVLASSQQRVKAQKQFQILKQETKQIKIKLMNSNSELRQKQREISQLSKEKEELLIRQRLQRKKRQEKRLGTEDSSTVKPLESKISMEDPEDLRKSQKKKGTSHMIESQSSSNINHKFISKQKLTEEDDNLIDTSTKGRRLKGNDVTKGQKDRVGINQSITVKDKQTNHLKKISSNTLGQSQGNKLKKIVSNQVARVNTIKSENQSLKGSHYINATLNQSANPNISQQGNPKINQESPSKAVHSGISKIVHSGVQMVAHSGLYFQEETIPEQIESMKEQIKSIAQQLKQKHQRHIKHKAQLLPGQQKLIEVADGSKVNCTSNNRQSYKTDMMTIATQTPCVESIGNSLHISGEDIIKPQKTVEEKVDGLIGHLSTIKDYPHPQTSQLLNQIKEIIDSFNLSVELPHSNSHIVHRNNGSLPQSEFLLLQSIRQSYQQSQNLSPLKFPSIAKKHQNSSSQLTDLSSLISKKNKSVFASASPVSFSFQKQNKSYLPKLTSCHQQSSLFSQYKTRNKIHRSKDSKMKVKPNRVLQRPSRILSGIGQQLFMLFLADNFAEKYEESFSEMSSRKEILKPTPLQMKELQNMFAQMQVIRKFKENLYLQICAFMRYPSSEAKNSFLATSIVNNIHFQTFVNYFLKILYIHRQCPRGSGTFCEHIVDFSLKIKEMASKNRTQTVKSGRH